MGKYQGKHSIPPGKPAKAPTHEEKPAKPNSHIEEPAKPKTHAEKPARAQEPVKRTAGAHAHVERPAKPKEESAPKRARPKKKKSRWFKYLMLFYLLVLLAATGYLQFRFWNQMKTDQAEIDREKAQSAAQKAHEKAAFQAPQLAFEDWENELSLDYWTDLWYEQTPNALDTREQVYAYMQEHFAPDAVQAYRAAEFTQEEPVYVLKNGEEPLARVTLSGGELEWGVSDVELLFEGAYSASVTVPSGCSVSCNGQGLGKEYSQPADSLMTYKLLNEQLENPVTWDCYSVDGLLMEPELTVKPPEGHDLLPYGDDGYLLLKGGDNSAYADRSVNFVRADVEYYMSGARGAGGNMSRALGFLRRGTQAYDVTREAYEGVTWSIHYNDIDTSKTYAGDVIVWADNCFSVDVTYDADCTLRGRAIDFADSTMRLYFLRDGDEYFISNFETL